MYQQEMQPENPESYKGRDRMRTEVEIVANPKVGDSVRGSMLGRYASHKYYWRRCSSCRKERWVNSSSPQTLLCQACSTRVWNPANAIRSFMLQNKGRTEEEVLANPQEGDVARGCALGKTAKQVWQACPRCGEFRWGQRIAIVKGQWCASCGVIRRAASTRETCRKKTIERNGGRTKDDMLANPREGDVIRVASGKRNSCFKCWQSCPSCGEFRWVFRNKRKPKQLCIRCSAALLVKAEADKRVAEGQPRYKVTYRGGYRIIRIGMDSPFWSMARVRGKGKVPKTGIVAEHRLAMAEHLGRCLELWEIVHHKNRVRDDNRLENLLVVTKQQNTAFGILEKVIKKLRKEIDTLAGRVTVLEAEVTLLRSQNTYTSVGGLDE